MSYKSIKKIVEDWGKIKPLPSSTFKISFMVNTFMSQNEIVIIGDSESVEKWKQVFENIAKK
jgi:hypothetical protein